MEFGTFRSQTRIVHGVGSSCRTGTEALELGMKKILILTDPIIRKVGCTKEIEVGLKDEGIPYIIYDHVSVDPGIEEVEHVVTLVQGEGIDGIIAVGGGSVICCAKAVALLLTNPGDLREFEGRFKADVPLFPLICVPTTAGSGSEVSPNFLISDKEKNWKMTFFGDYYAKLAILDPLLLKSLPSGPAINASLDALTHAIEAYLSNQSSLFSDALALQAASLIYKNIVESSLTDDIDAKHTVLIASTMANIACGNAGLTLVHAVTYGLPELEHGFACGVMLPYVMEFNRTACIERMADLAIAFGCEPYGKSKDELSIECIEKIKELYQKLSFVDQLPDKVDRNNISEIIEGTLNAPMIHFNIRQPSKSDIKLMIESAFDGWRGNEVEESVL
ncbi:iron-containing alcohol dehydrogenase [Peribacillus cavernae]|uniref:Iron-containing alcohol dehydrogenase n=1 Tax=Peribacillus cavernae TaxID=1674310 RepID=A0A3S1B952_9BACI|nr:iron-containing alcohol dehydrogenase [Peribacillus cavernae]MDQ0218745.1 alcohol dehydrogenase class IV [Peribacillus cavernae]RUQ30958.1 iron-containing alcohol dehydrogenase [Peribacillus cavernae]